MRKLPILVLLAAAPVFAPTGMAQQGQMPDLAAMFTQQFDTDKDGKVSLEEYLDPQVEQMEQQFNNMDTNGDGVVDQSEIQAMADMMRQRMEQMRQQQGGGMQGR